MRFSGNVPPSGWPVAYRSILDSDCSAVELALVAANRNNGHMAVETVAILRLTTTVTPNSHFRPKLCAKNGLKLGQIGHPRGVI